RPSRAELLERFFMAPSCTSSRWSGVTAFTERSVLAEHGPLDRALLQAQDYALWLALLKKYDFEIMPERLYLLRIRAGFENLSGPAPAKQIRLINELYLAMRSFFQGIPTDLFREAFRRHLINPDFTSETERACEEAFLYLRSTRRLLPLV